MISQYCSFKVLQTNIVLFFFKEKNRIYIKSELVCRFEVLCFFRTRSESSSASHTKLTACDEVEEDLKQTIETMNWSGNVCWGHQQVRRRLKASIQSELVLRPLLDIRQTAGLQTLESKCCTFNKIHSMCKSENSDAKNQKYRRCKITACKVMLRWVVPV